MNKEDSTLLKGVSILMMLYWHLFYNPINVDCCNNCLEIDGMPLALLLSRATNPVPFFVILSGYGIYIQSLKREIKVNKKLWKLYSMYWLSCAVFVPIGYWLIGLDRYPGNIIDIISNLSGWKPTWNGEVWFLFPYVVVSLLLSKYLLRIRWNPVVVLLVAFLVGICGQYLVSRFGASFLYSHRLWHMPIICLNFLFPFMLGVYMAKFKIIEFFEENVRGGAFFLVADYHVNCRKVSFPYRGLSYAICCSIYCTILLGAKAFIYEKILFNMWGKFYDDVVLSYLFLLLSFS